MLGGGLNPLRGLLVASSTAGKLFSARTQSQVLEYGLSDSERGQERSNPRVCVTV
jgi:hypothetical protein